MTRTGRILSLGCLLLALPTMTMAGGNSLLVPATARCALNALPEELPTALRACQQAHRRNETLVHHQLAAVRGALGALTADSALQSVEVYDRMGQMSARRRGRGSSDA